MNWNTTKEKKEKRENQASKKKCEIWTKILLKKEGKNQSNRDKNK
jgi:hypothetical protein